MQALTLIDLSFIGLGNGPTTGSTEECQTPPPRKGQKSSTKTPPRPPPRLNTTASPIHSRPKPPPRPCIVTSPTYQRLSASRKARGRQRQSQTLSWSDYHSRPLTSIRKIPVQQGHRMTPCSSIVNKKVLRRTPNGSRTAALQIASLQATHATDSRVEDHTL